LESTYKKHYESTITKARLKCKSKAVQLKPRGGGGIVSQEVKAPRYLDKGTGWW
jgi:hypothetical protein